MTPFFEVGRIGEDLFGHFRRGPDGEPVVIADHSGKLVLVFAKIGLEVDVNAAVFEDLNGGVREFVGNKHFGGHDWRSFFE